MSSFVPFRIPIRIEAKSFITFLCVGIGFLLSRFPTYVSLPLWGIVISVKVSVSVSFSGTPALLLVTVFYRSLCLTDEF